MGNKNKNKNKSSHKQTIPAAGSREERFDTSNKPQFRPPRNQSASKVVLDDRFKSVLTDPRFQLTVPDKYGRKLKKKTAQEELAAFYTVQDDDSHEKEQEQREKQREREHDHDESVSDSSLEEDKEATEDPASRIAYLTALSRGELELSSSSSEEDSNDENDDDSSENDDNSTDSDEGSADPVHGRAGVLDPSTQQQEDIEITHEETPYLAVLNMDWSHVRAVDIFALVSSFAPPGTVKRVQVYPSDFGMERIAKEEQFGPTGLWKKSKKANIPRDGGDDAMNNMQEPGNSDDVDDQSNLSDNMDGDDSDLDNGTERKDFVESDFDPEKLRAYEASKLKYYFAIVELTHPQHADKAYKEIDGMEFEHSSAAVDMRSIPPCDLENVIKDRPLRDEATSIPSNFEPPEFVVSALQQTNVQCSWETGDRERELALTKYSSGLTWQSMAESDDLMAYLASDVSSDEEDNDGGGNEKSVNLRKMLGLDSDDEKGDAVEKTADVGSGSDSADDIESESEEEEDTADQSKEVTFVPGKSKLEDKIRSKLEGKDSKEELTPWEKYQLRQKQKRRERRQAARAKKKEFNELRKNGTEPRTSASKAHSDSFFLDTDGAETEQAEPAKQSQAELELLLAGDGDDEQTRDFDMRGLQRLDKNKDKKLRGPRKRKEAERASGVTGTDFKVNVSDERFKAVLDGVDDRFGIDRTDPNYKETPAMREILAEQTRRRKAKRRKGTSSDNASRIQDVSADVAMTASKPVGGAAALSALVKSLKAKVQ